MLCIDLGKYLVSVARLGAYPQIDPCFYPNTTKNPGKFLRELGPAKKNTSLRVN